MCGFEGCGEPIDHENVDRDDDEVSCQKHKLTWNTGYKYLDQTECQIKYGQEASFQDSFNAAHKNLHTEGDRDCLPGRIDDSRKQGATAGRDYGAWSGSALTVMYRSTRLYPCQKVDFSNQPQQPFPLTIIKHKNT